MNCDAILITKPAVDFNNLLAISHQALGYSPAKKSDESRRDLSDTEKYLSCLAAMMDQQAAVGFAPELLNQVSFSVLVAVEEEDLLAVIQYCSGMAVTPCDTRYRGLKLSVFHGTLQQWREAVVAGTRAKVNTVGELFCKIMGQFEGHGLSVWQGYNKHFYDSSSLFSLEDRTK